MAKNDLAQSITPGTKITYIDNHNREHSVDVGDPRLKGTNIYKDADGNYLAVDPGSQADQSFGRAKTQKDAPKLVGGYTDSPVGAAAKQGAATTDRKVQQFVDKSASAAGSSAPDTGLSAHGFPAGMQLTAQDPKTGKVAGSYTVQANGSVTSNDGTGGAFSSTNVSPQIRIGMTDSGDIDPRTGRETSTKVESYAAMGGGTPGNPDLIDRLFELDDKQFQALQQKMIDAGYMKPSDRSGAMNAQFAQDYTVMLNDVRAGQQHSGTNNLTPDQFLDKAIKGRKAAGLTGNGVTGTDSSTTVSLTSSVDARALAMQTFQKELGHGASEKQIAAFTQALQAYEQANPSVSNSTITRDKSTGLPIKTVTTQKSREQISPADAASNYVHSGALGTEANTFKIATDYYAQALDALGLGGHGGPNMPNVTMAERPLP